MEGWEKNGGIADIEMEKITNKEKELKWIVYLHFIFRFDLKLS
jgi:hypothetical protein